MGAIDERIVGGTTSARVNALDGLRGVAVLVVVALHTDGMFNGVNSRFFAGGGLGVDLFFVLSGFLITGLLIKERTGTGRIDFLGFYIRRAFRLLPPLYVMLAVYLVYGLVGPVRFGAVAKAVFFVVTYGFNLAHVAQINLPNDLGHLWSLSIEEQFYFVWPLVVLGLVRLKPDYVVPILLGGVAVIGIDRAITFETAGSLAAHLRTDVRLDGLMLGAVVAVLSQRGKLAPRACGIAGALGALYFTVMVLAPNSLFGGLKNRDAFLCKGGGYTLVAIACAAMIAAIASGAWENQRLLTWKPLRAVGLVSYGLYLWHGLLFHILGREIFDQPGVVQVAIVWSASALATVVSWYAIEKPAHRKRVEIEARRRERALAAA